jgi:hypothetical protein
MSEPLRQMDTARTVLRNYRAYRTRRYDYRQVNHSLNSQLSQWLTLGVLPLPRPLVQHLLYTTKLLKPSNHTMVRFRSC